MKRILLLLTFCCGAHASNWDIEYWQYFTKTQLDCSLFKVYMTGLVRLDRDITRFYYYRISEDFSYKALCWLDLEAHYSFIYSKPRGASSFTTKNRLELEINPTLYFDNGVQWRWRNRLDIVKIQHTSEIQYVLRERLLIRIPLCGTKVFAYTLYDEVFYDLDQKKITENRFVPMELSLGLCLVDLYLFVMMRNFYSVDQWYKSYVLGTNLRF